MPASNLKELLNFEGHFERATRDLLVAAGYADTFIQQANETLPETRLEVTFAAGAAINEEEQADGSRVYDFFEGMLTVRIVTVRPADRPSLIVGVANLHEEFSAGVRSALLEKAAPFTTANLTHYAVKTIRPPRRATSIRAGLRITRAWSSSCILASAPPPGRPEPGFYG
jgi:hypothetical protein